MEKIYQGAEAVITFDGLSIRKERIKKGYRIAKMDDALRKKRTSLEASLMRAAARNGVLVPSIFEDGDFHIKMEYIRGLNVRDMSDWSIVEIAGAIGQSIAKIHDAGIIHGDLTTSNMIYCPGSIYFIDFGLGFFSQKMEDKATDLRLFKQVLQSTHFSASCQIWEHFIAGYSRSQQAREVIKRLTETDEKGRYKEKRRH